MWKSLVTTAMRRQPAGSAWMVSEKKALPTCRLDAAGSVRWQWVGRAEQLTQQAGRQAASMPMLPAVLRARPGMVAGIAAAVGKGAERLNMGVCADQQLARPRLAPLLTVSKLDVSLIMAWAGTPRCGSRGLQQQQEWLYC
jgi:hypothetical protein